jgi:hypothetical protein
MADGLRLLGSCPKCGSTLEFRDDARAEARGDRFEPPLEPALAVGPTAPHLVLGIPRR